jgi:hypothetical protein
MFEATAAGADRRLAATDAEDLHSDDVTKNAGGRAFEVRIGLVTGAIVDVQISEKG